MKTCRARNLKLFAYVLCTALSLTVTSAWATNYCSASAGRGFGGFVSAGVSGSYSIEIIGASAGRQGAKIRATSTYLAGASWVSTSEELPLFVDGYTSADYNQSRRVGYVWSVLWTIWNASSSNSFIYNRDYSVLSDIYINILGYQTWAPQAGACE